MDRLGIAAVAALALGGILYSVGGVIYARKRPDPVPAVFDTTSCSIPWLSLPPGLQYAVVAFWIL